MKTALVIVSLTVILGLVGMMDYQDAKLESVLYKHNVCEGIWPDYKNLKVKCND